MTRIVIAGGPRTGKTSFARTLGQHRSTDDLIGTHDWSGVSELVASQWMVAPGPWVIEGVAAVRALRKWLVAHPEGKPCDVVHWLRKPMVARSPGQETMAKGCESVWREVEPELRRRGVEVVSR